MEKNILKDKNLNVLEKVFAATIVVPVACAVQKADEVVEETTGKGIIERGAESIEKEEEEKKNHYWRWAGKKLLKGTISGIIGGSVHNRS